MELAKLNEPGKNSAYIQQIMSDMKNGVLALDRKGTVIYSNPQMNAFFEKESLQDETVYSLSHENENSTNDAFWDTIMDVIYGHIIHYQKKVSFISPSGREYNFHIVSSYLTGEVDGIVITVADETEYELLIRKKHDTTFVLIGILLLVCLTVLVTELHVFVDGAFPHDWIARFTEISACLFLGFVLKYTSLTWKDFDIVPKNLRKELLESFFVLAVMITGMSVGKMILATSGTDLFPENRPFFDFTVPGFYYIKYIGIVFLQDLETKCGLQKSITKILDNKHGNILAIAVTSIMFMALHVQHGLVYMIGAGILSAVLAVLYNRHQSLLGCCIVHYAFGIFGLVLGWIG